MMTGKTFLKKIGGGETDAVEVLLSLLRAVEAKYCVIGGLAVNAYADPVVSLDLDLVVVSSAVNNLQKAARARKIKVQEFGHSLNFSVPGSDLRIQVQKDPRYQPFIGRSGLKNVLGYEMAVADVKDVLQGKIWAYSDDTPRKSKRQKDLTDIMRLVETRPKLKTRLPPEIVALI